MRALALRSLLAIALVFVLSACAAGAGDADTAATVDGETIPISVVEERFEQAKAQPQVAEQLEADENGQFESEVQAQILSQLIVAEILEQWADELGIEASPEEVSSEREALVEQSGGQEAFDEQLEQSGFTEEQLDDLLRQRVLQTKVSEEVAAEGDAEVTDAEVTEFYEQNKETQFGEKASARHILVEDEAEAKKLKAELDDGADFAELAQEHSTDTGSGAEGGDLGEFGRGQMVPEFDEVAFSAEIGEVVGPVQTQFGFHIIEVTDRSEGQTLDEAREEIETQLAQTQEGEAVEAALRERTTKAEVEVNPRFGEWDAEAGQVRPDNPLGDEEATDPAAGGEEGTGTEPATSPTP